MVQRFFLIAVTMLALNVFWAGNAVYAQCSNCDKDQLLQGEFIYRNLAKYNTERIFDDWRARFSSHRDWLVGITPKDNGHSFFTGYILNGLKLFTEQSNAMHMKHADMIGRIYDAKHQLETQRLLQERQYEAHRDYFPSEGMCVTGTLSRSLLGSSAKADDFRKKILERTHDRHFLAGDRYPIADMRKRWDTFTTEYCDPYDNNYRLEHKTGLTAICKNSNKHKMNFDIDYTGSIDNPRTIYDSIYNFDDVFALANNLYGHNALMRGLRGQSLMTRSTSQYKYFGLRHIAAKRGVAQHSFNKIAGMKMPGSTDLEASSDPNTELFMNHVLRSFGVREDEIATEKDTPPDKEKNEVLGDKPSYYAQLEMLGQKLYQTPNFYAGLYDKPANVKRKEVAMKAIALMLDREMFESDLRQEMALSVLLSSRQWGAMEEAMQEQAK